MCASVGFLSQNGLPSRDRSSSFGLNVVMTFSVLMTFTDFQLIYVITRGGPLNATHLMATLSFQRAISGGSLGEGAAIATAMVPFLLAVILLSYFGLQRRAWQQGGADK